MSIYYFYYSEVVNNTGVHVPKSLTLGTFGLVPRLPYSTHAEFIQRVGNYTNRYVDIGRS